MNDLYQIFLKSSGVTTDTRNIEKNQMFFALKGSNFNANTFAAKAIEQGAMVAVIDDETYKTNDQCILVDDVLETLQKLANYHRKQFKIPVIGLTGSNGKTTNKELLMRALSLKYKVHATKGNLNNHIGVPLTLLSMPLATEMAIIEMGANHQKEIEMLCNICEPSHGFITNLGKAHLEGFGGEEGVRKGKGELFDYLKEHRGTVFANQSDQNLISLVKEKQIMTVVYYGLDEPVLKMQQESPVVKFSYENVGFAACLSGKYNFENIQSAFAISSFFNVNKTEVCKELAAYNPDNNRSQMLEKGSNSFMMDAYNANPSSMAAAIANFANLETIKNKFVILGDMFELGAFAQSEHEALGKEVANCAFDGVILFGENMKYALAALPNAFYFTDKFSLHNWLQDQHFENTFFLVKGSRSVSLESILGCFAC